MKYKHLLTELEQICIFYRIFYINIAVLHFIYLFFFPEGRSPLLVRGVREANNLPKSRIF